MIVVDVKIQSLADVSRGVPILEDMKDLSNTKEIPKLTVAMLEGGMQTGKMSVMFILTEESPTGGARQHYVAECSGGQFQQIYDIYKGAMKRFHPDSKLN